MGLTDADVAELDLGRFPQLQLLTLQDNDIRASPAWLLGSSWKATDTTGLDAYSDGPTRWISGTAAVGGSVERDVRGDRRYI